MLKSYLKSLYRNFFRNKFFSVLNIIGLSIGLTTSIFILLYVNDELGYDKHHTKAGRIYRLESEFNMNNSISRYAIAPIPLGPALKNEIPEIEHVVRLDKFGEHLIRIGEREYFESNFYLADSTMFEIFSHEFLYGNPEHALKQPFSIVLTESVSEKYFGEEHPIDQILETESGEKFKVTGVVEDQAGNSHLKFDALISMSTFSEDYSITKPSRFWRVGVFTFILLHENASIETVHEKFLDFYHSNMEELGNRFNVSFLLTMTKLTDTHFREGLMGELPSGKRIYMLIFSAIALFILLLAAINYMNMATARSANRAKEVGLRKVVGADKGQLISQFLGESLILTFIALLISIFFAYLFMDNFNLLAGKEISLNFFSNIHVYVQLLIVAILIGIIAGSYPAFYLSSFQPVYVLKGGSGKSGQGSLLFRRVLVTFQFFIALSMIMATVVISSQIRFLHQKELGFEKENIIVLNLADISQNNLDAFKDELNSHVNILGVSNSSGIPGNIGWTNNVRVEQPEGMENMSILICQTDFDFMNLYDLKLTSGRNFDRSMGTDNMEAVILNEAAVYKFGWIESPLDKKIHFGYGQDGSGGRMMKVVGVASDFHFSSLHNSIEPLLIFITEGPQQKLSIKMGADNHEQTITYIEETWKSFGFNYPVKYEYLTEKLDNMYQAEEKIGQIFGFTTIITILIALLGLLGLSSYMAEKRLKEIGIRKIHGAGIKSILSLLYKDYVIMFIVAYIIAVPIAWWQLNDWLQVNFIYAITPGWSTFILAGLLTFIVGMLTMSFYILKAATGDPLKAIKYE